MPQGLHRSEGETGLRLRRDGVQERVRNEDAELRVRKLLNIDHNLDWLDSLVALVTRQNSLVAMCYRFVPRVEQGCCNTQ